MQETINLSNHLIESVKNHDQNKIALKDDVSCLYYKDIESNIKTFAQRLLDHKVMPGDKVGMLFGDSIEWCIGFFAVLYVGANPVLLSPRVPANNISSMLKSCCARFLLYSKAEIDLKDYDLHPNLVPIEKELILQPGPKATNYYNFNPDEISLWCCSSGTSGKGQRFVLHRHQNMFKAIDINIKMHSIDNNSVIFSTPKLSFQYGLMNMIYGLIQGGTVILSSKMPVRQNVCGAVKENNVTHLYTTPGILASMIKIDRPTNDLKSVSHVVCGGETLPKLVENKFKELYSKDIFNGIGMAEILTWATSQNPNNKKPGTIGIPLDHVTYEVRNKETGEICNPYEYGELYVLHPSVALMYWNFAEHTKETFVKGWFKTNDIVYKDDDGFLVYVCRSDDMMKINGSYVNPIELEEQILQHPSIEECIVTSKNNQFDLPEILTNIILVEGVTLEPGDVRKFLSGKIENHMIPKHINFVTEIPRTVTTKKIRSLARE